MPVSLIPEQFHGLLGVLLASLTIFMVSETIKSIFESILIVRKTRNKVAKTNLSEIAINYKRVTDRLRPEIEPKLELWWNEYGKHQLVPSGELLKEMGAPSILQQLPEMLLEDIQQQVFEMLKGDALQLAIHLVAKESFEEMIAKIKRKVGEDQAAGNIVPPPSAPPLTTTPGYELGVFNCSITLGTHKKSSIRVWRILPLYKAAAG